jgi:hypothetical protein
MSQPFFYCSALSRRLAEQTYGTASTGDLWLLIEYPFEWKSKAFHESVLSTGVKAHLNKLLKIIPRARLLFIKRDRVKDSKFNVFLVRCRERNPSIVSFAIRDYEQLLSLDAANILAGEPPPQGAIFDAPLYLVCTHGKRDKCCAKFGYPLYKVLRSTGGDFAVWQSTHVGGDRFAANLICFPHGLFYAHVTEETGRTMIDEYERRRLVLEKYRGRACYSHHVQAAEFFIRAESALNGIDELRFLNTERIAEKRWRVRFVAHEGERVHEALVSTVMSEFHSYKTCQSTEETQVSQYVLDEYHTPV